MLKQNISILKAEIDRRWRLERVGISAHTLYMDIQYAEKAGVGRDEIVNQINRRLALNGLKHAYPVHTLHNHDRN